MKMRILSYFYGIIMVSTIIVLNGCEKDNSVQVDEIAIEKEIATVPFFLVEKGDSVSKAVYRDKPDFENPNEVEFISSEEIEKGLKSTNGITPYVTDLYIIAGTSSSIAPPSTYFKIDVDLNIGAGGRFIYLCFSRSDDHPPLQGLSIYSGGNRIPNPEIPYPWIQGVVTSNYNGYTYPGYDLNDRAGGDWIYLYQTRVANILNPYEGYKLWSKITAIGVYSATSSSAVQVPTGWKRIPKDLNKGAGGRFVYIVYKTEI